MSVRQRRSKEGSVSEGVNWSRRFDCFPSPPHPRGCHKIRVVRAFSFSWSWWGIWDQELTPGQVPEAARDPPPWMAEGAVCSGLDCPGFLLSHGVGFPPLGPLSGKESASSGPICRPSLPGSLSLRMDMWRRPLGKPRAQLCVGCSSDAGALIKL